MKALSVIMVKKTLVTFVIFASLVPLQAAAMQTPMIIAGDFAATVSNTVTRHIACTGFGGTTAAAGAINTPIAATGTISTLRARFPNTITTGTWDITVQKNGVDTTLTVRGESGSQTPVDTEAVSFDAGDLCNIKIVPTGTPTTQDDNIQISMLFEGTESGVSIITGRGGLASTTVAQYGPIGHSRNVDTEAQMSIPFPTSGTIDRMYVSLDGAPGAGTSYDITLRENGATSNITCQISGTNTTCNDSGTVTLTPGELVAVEVTPTGAPTQRNVTYGFRFTPTTDGESILTSSNGNPNASSPRFIPMGGFTTNEATETETYAVAPVAFAIKNLYLDYIGSPGAGNSRSVAPRVNQATSTSVVATVSETNTTANDTTDSQSVVSGDLINWVTEPVSGPNSPTRMRIAAVMFIDPGTVYQSARYRLYNLGQMLLNAGTFILR